MADNLTPEELRESFFRCCRENDVDQLQALINNGGNVYLNAKNMFEETPLHIALRNRPNIHIVNILIQLGANKSEIDHLGATPIHFAVRNNAVECLELLLDHEEYINIKDREGNTPLHWAAHHNSRECLKFLIEIGADINQQNKYGFTFFRYVYDERFEKEIRKYIQQSIEINMKEPYSS